jgi:hypothetical protein
VSPAPRVTAAVGVLALALGGVLFAAAPASAANFDVTIPGDGAADVGTLRWALTEAENNVGPDTITILYTGAIPAGGMPLPTITEDVTISGPGAGNLIVNAAGTVFDITGGTVSISGLTLASADAGASGVYSTGADLTLTDIVADGFADYGIYAEAGTIDLTDVSANGNGANGIDAHATDPSDDVTLTRPVADSNAFVGIDASVQGGVLTATDLQANSNDFVGVALTVAPGAVGSVTGSTANDNGLFGFVANADDAQLTVTGSTTDRNSVGTFANAGNAATITLSGSSASNNGSEGFVITSTDSTVSLLSSDSISNGNDPCGCGGPGVSIDASASAITISDVDITDNEATFGAGIDVVELLGGSSLLIADARILRNVAIEDLGSGGLGGGIAVEFFADAGTTMTVRDSLIDHNTADLGGGGIFLGDIGSGDATGGVTILRTTISNNTGTLGTSAGGGINIDGFSHTVDGSPILTIDSSTISGNSADDSGGIGGFKRFTTADPGVIDIVNSTISGNVAGQNGAGYFGSDAAVGNAIIRVRHSTVLGNTASGRLGGLFVDYELDFLLDHSILAFNTPGDLQIDPLNVTTARWNIVRDPTVATAALLTVADHNSLGIDPKLGPLAANGGATLTHLPLEGSPAIDRGDPAFAAPPALDQRGGPRIVRIIDIGAVEVPIRPLPATGSTPPGPEPLLVAILMLLVGTALLAGSRLRAIA